MLDSGSANIKGIVNGLNKTYLTLSPLLNPDRASRFRRTLPNDCPFLLWNKNRAKVFFFPMMITFWIFVSYRKSVKCGRSGLLSEVFQQRNDGIHSHKKTTEKIEETQEKHKK